MAQDNLIELVGSRICHDLISPLGAISNGVELMEMAGSTMDGPEMALIAESIEAANARVRFFRLAFGHAPNGADIARTEITQLLGAATKSSKLSFYWSAAGTLPRREVRAVFLALMCLESAMPRGGEISVNREEALWTLVAEADQFRIDDALWQAVQHNRQRPAISAAQVQFALLPKVLAELDRAAAVRITEQSLTLTF